MYVYIYMENLSGFNYPSRVVDDENELFMAPWGNTPATLVLHPPAVAHGVSARSVRTGGTTADSLLRGMFRYP